MCQFLPIACIRVKGWEADDVIATLVRSEPNEQFIIESTDVDFMQLPNVRIAREKPAPVEPQYMRLYKTLVGDPSDNIGGLKGFGKGAWGGSAGSLGSRWCHNVHSHIFIASVSGPPRAE